MAGVDVVQINGVHIDSKHGNFCVKMGDSNSLDAFGRLRVSSPYTLFDSKQDIRNHDLFWVSKLIGGASELYVKDEALTYLKVTTASGDKITHQTKEYFAYQPGKSFLLQITGVVGTKKTNVRQRLGYFDDNNGVFFEQDSSNLKVVVRSAVIGSPIDNVVVQSSWNLDKLDGSGLSGIIIDMTKNQLFVIDFAWLSVGRVRFGFQLDGELVYCHEFNHGNYIDSVYMSTPTLPVRYELENTGDTASDTEMKDICVSVISEGGYNPKTVHRNIVTENSKTVGISLLPLLAIRLKDLYKTATIIARRISGISLAQGKHVVMKLIYNPSLTGGTWDSVSDESITEYSTDITSISGGEIIESVFISGGNFGEKGLSDIAESSLLKLHTDTLNDIRDVYVVAVATIDGVSSDVFASISWGEVF